MVKNRDCEKRNKKEQIREINEENRQIEILKEKLKENRDT